MINIKEAQKYCKEDISKIKNYDKAISDNTQTWDLHHMTETWWNCSRQDLIDNECYYHRKACELIFLTHEEHTSLHKKGKILSVEHRRKLSEAKKGNTNNRGIFGKAFKEHYGITLCDDCKLYVKEYSFYKRHGHFSWEVN